MLFDKSNICQSSVVLKKFLKIPEADKEVITHLKLCTIENPQKPSQAYVRWLLCLFEIFHMEDLLNFQL